MSTDVHSDEAYLCLVCNKAVKNSAVSINSSLARRPGSIRDQITEIVGDEDASEAYRVSEVVCPLCLKLLLSINNVELELRDLKVEFLGIFQLGVVSRTGEVDEGTTCSKAIIDKVLKSKPVSESTDKTILRANVRTEEVCGRGNIYGDIVVESIKESFVDHDEKGPPLCTEEKESGILGENGEVTCSVIHVSHEGDLESPKDAKLSLNILKENIDPLEFNSSILDKAKKGTRAGIESDAIEVTAFIPKENASILDRGQEQVNQEKEEVEIDDGHSLSPNGVGSPEGNIVLEFENFETQLCPTDVNRKTRKKRSSATMKKSRNRSLSQGGRAKRKKPSKSGRKGSKIETSSLKGAEADADWCPDKDASEDCRLKEANSRSVDSCTDKFCKLCNQAFSSSDELAVHRGRAHGDVYKFVCDKCPNVRYRHKSKLTQHVKLRHKANVHQCPGCDVEEASQNSLDQHIIQKHPESRFFKCEVCHKAFRTYRYLHFVHIKRCHVGLPYKYFCDICNKGSVDKSSHDNHKYTHSQTKDYVCEFCGALFHAPYSLKVHVNIHTREKKYTCSECGVSYLRQSNLIDHKKRTHHSLEKRYVCEICGLLLLTNKNLVKHQAACHKNGNGSICKICGKNFPNRKSLESHIRIEHDQERLYKCDCGKSFEDQFLYQYHLKDAHGLETFDQLTVHTGLLDECFKTVSEEETNPEENMVVITVKECSASSTGLFTVQTTSPDASEVVIGSNGCGSVVEENGVSQALTSSTQGVDLPLLSSPFNDRLGLSTPMLFTSLSANPTSVVHEEVIPHCKSPLKLESPMSQITGGIQGATFPFQAVSNTIAEDQDPLKVLQERTRASQVADPLPTELLELPNIHSSTSTGVPVTYITAWPT